MCLIATLEAGNSLIMRVSESVPSRTCAWMREHTRSPGRQGLSGSWSRRTPAVTGPAEFQNGLEPDLLNVDQPHASWQNGWTGYRRARRPCAACTVPSVLPERFSAKTIHLIHVASSAETSQDQQIWLSSTLLKSTAIGDRACNI